jgi:dihydrofolate reductase
MLLSVNAFVSLDGVMQGPAATDEDRSGGFTRGGWLVPHASPALDAAVCGWMGEADALLLGRNTFERMREHWARVSDPDDVVASAMKFGRTFVVSTTLTEQQIGWLPVIVLPGDPVESVRILKEQPGRELQVHGSWRLARALHDAGLVDVYRLVQVPVVVGQGKRLFENGAIPAMYQVDPAGSGVLDGGALALTLRRAAFGTVHPGRHAAGAAGGQHGGATP